ncbi:MAG: PEP-utilizing enzyme [Myxococcota bacterium]
MAAAAADADLDALAAGTAPSAGFAAALTDFLDRFGHRSEASWSSRAPAGARTRRRLVPLLRAQRRAGADPAARAAAQARGHAGARWPSFERSLAGPRLSSRMCADYARRYLLLRENQRFWFDRLLASLQGVLLGLGARAVAAGALDDPGDVAMLTWDELRGWVEDALPGDESLRARVAARRAQREADAAVTPPTFLLDDAPATEPTAADGRLQGLGISAGRVRGPVRVVRTLADGDDLRPGEVLVAHAVDPAWTPLFLSASGVVLELGSMLSHGAVLAREYRLPAVVNIDGATERLRTGDEVTVDGTRGLVWHHPIGPVTPPPVTPAPAAATAPGDDAAPIDTPGR